MARRRIVVPGGGFAQINTDFYSNGLAIRSWSVFYYCDCIYGLLLNFFSFLPTYRFCCFLGNDYLATDFTQINTDNFSVYNWSIICGLYSIIVTAWESYISGINCWKPTTFDCRGQRICVHYIIYLVKMNLCASVSAAGDLCPSVSNSFPLNTTR